MAASVFTMGKMFKNFGPGAPLLPSVGVAWGCYISIELPSLYLLSTLYQAAATRGIGRGTGLAIMWRSGSPGVLLDIGRSMKPKSLSDA